MVKRQASAGDSEPEQMKFEMPSEKEHLLQVTDIITFEDELGGKLGLDENTVCAKLEVVGGEEEGRTLLQRLSLDSNWKGFFATRLFLKAIGEEYKGDITLDTDDWIGKQVYATVIHAQSKGKTFANVDQYNYEKKIEQHKRPVGETNQVVNPQDIAWDE